MTIQEKFDYILDKLSISTLTYPIMFMSYTKRGYFPKNIVDLIKDFVGDERDVGCFDNKTILFVHLAYEYLKKNQEKL